jgi:hypothetical protein
MNAALDSFLERISIAETSLKNNTEKIFVVRVLYFKAYAKNLYTSGNEKLHPRATNPQ